MEQQNPNRHVTQVLPDKCLCDLFFRSQFVGRKKTNGHDHEDRTVMFYPDDVFMSDDSDEEIFFIPITLKNSISEEKNEKIPIPIFMLNFTPCQKEEIKSLGRKKGIKIGEKFFFKPKISLTYEERLDRELDLSGSAEEFNSLTKFGYAKEGTF
jgi:hypothetical protein